MNYVPLYIKTHNDLLSSMIKIEDLISFALQNNISSLTITDNHLYGAMEFYKECKKNTIKPIIGLDITYQNHSILLYAKNYKGYKNLLKLATLQSEGNITMEVLQNYSSDLICILPYSSNHLQECLSFYERIYQGYETIEQRKTLKENNCVFCKPSFYLEKNDANYMPILIAMKEKILLKDVQNPPLENYIYKQEDLTIFPIEDLENNFAIEKNCNLEIEKDTNLLPVYDCPDNLDSYTYLKKLCKEGLIRIFGKTVNKIYLERLKYELDIIHKMGFDNYFLVVWDYVKYAKEQNILVAPGRGSAAGSLVSYCLNITTIDPIKYNLLFERFLNPERISMPDIDMDFDAEKREEVISYCISKYGIKRVAPIIAFGTLKARQAIKDVARVYNMNGKNVEVLCNLLDRNTSLKENYQNNQQIKNYLNMEPELKKIYQIATKFEDLNRHTTIHAAGVVMSKIDLEEVIPLDKTHEFYVTGFSMEYLEELGLLKMDFLAISFLTLISNILKDIEKQTNQKIDFDSIPLNDLKTMQIFTEVKTLGIFQFESSGMMNFLRKLKPNTFEEIVAAIALFRPGPMDNIDTYIRRKRGKEKVTYIVPQLESILKSTYGIIIYQEQIMQIAATLAGYSLGQADVLRKAMSKKKEDILLKEKERFVQGCIKNRIPKDKAEEIYALILKFASYGFNRSHSVAYSIVAYKMAYLKTYYPNIFIKNLLTRFINSEEKTKEYIYDCKKNGVVILKPLINSSTDAYETTKNGILFPLTIIKNVGAGAIRVILEERKKGKFKDIFDFVSRTYGKSINKKTLESLIDAGVFDEFSYNKKTLQMNLDKIINYGELGDLLTEQEALKPVIEQQEEYTSQELLKRELEVFGFYFSDHPVTSFKKEKNNTFYFEQLELYFDQIVDTIAYVETIKEITTKKGEKMVFITGSDETSFADIVLFPRLYEKIPLLKIGDVIEITGKIEKRFDKYQIVATNLKLLQR